MGKRLVHDYEFSADSSKITFNEILSQDRFLLITNVSDGAGLFTFNDPSNKIIDTAYDYENTKTTITLQKDTSSMSDSDVLQVFIEDNASRVEFSETYIDPVAKIRVSQPENLIDTDFEYGLQSTKWETLELVKNIPTFFSRNGDISLNVSSITTTSGSDLITVSCTDAHGLARGAPILVQGSTLNLANGGFVVTAVQDDNTFEFKAKSVATSSGSIFDTYTQIFIASIYQGTEFDLQGIAAVTTDEGATSRLKVKTQFPTDFKEGTSFFLTNSFAKASLNFPADSTAVDPLNASIVTKTSAVNNQPTGEDGDDHAYGMVQPLAWKPHTMLNNTAGTMMTGAFWVNEEDYEYTSNGRLIFPNGHGLSYVNSYPFPIRYRPGEGATGLSRFVSNENTGASQNMTLASYWGRVVSDTEIQLFIRYNSSSTSYLANLHDGSARSNGITKSVFYVSLPYYLINNSYWYHHSTVDNYQYRTTSFANVRQPFIDAGVERWLINMDYWSLFGRYWPRVGAQENPEWLRMTLNGTDDADGWVWFNVGNNIASTIAVGNNWQLSRFARTAGGSYSDLRTTRSRNTDASPDSDPAWYYVQVTPFERSETGNSFYIANHGFGDGTPITLTTVAGTLPENVSNGQYVVRYVNENRIGLRTLAGDDVNFRSAGSADLQIAITGVSLNANNDTIKIVDNTFSNGDAVVYNNNGEQDIPGLTNDTTYYVYEKAGDFFKLATTPTGLDSAQIVVDQKSTTADPRIDASNSNIFSSSNGFTSGDIIKVTQLTGPNEAGAVDGSFYFIGKSGNSITLYPTDSDRVNDLNAIPLTRTGTDGTFKAQKTTMVDITGTGSGTHNLLANFVGAADGVYSLDSSYESAGAPIFTLQNVGRILRRDQALILEQGVDLYANAFKLKNHGYITGNTLEWTQSGGTVPSNIQRDRLYYIKRVSKDWFRLANSEAQALDSDNAYISLDSAGSGTAVLLGTSVVGETSGVGNVSYTQNSNTIIGENTTFTSLFNTGDQFDIYVTPKTQTLTGAWNISTNQFTADSNLDSSISFISGMSAYPTGDVSGLTDSNRYYAHEVSSNVYQLMSNPTDAAAGNNAISVATTGTNPTITIQSDIGKTIESTISYVNSTNQLEVTEEITDSTATNANYAVRSKLLMRADGFALHRPYDGGVELIPSTNPDSKMIRQTRKYFRYQSGKGIQVSFAVNFKPTVDIESLTRTDSIGTITTRYPHRINISDSSDNVNVVIKNANNGDDYWNGNHRVLSADDYSFNIQLDGVPNDVSATGTPEYYVDNWENCSLLCGLFDDQNGLFYEFDGEQLYAGIRSSTKQISGFASVQFKSGEVRGNAATKFTQQLSVGENVVIKGQTYVITKVKNDRSFNILPSYRGADADNVIITKTIDRKVPQNSWNIDKCDGTGVTGFKLDLAKIQMAYIDYSWYGAGKVRFGFKDQHGIVRYVHEFVHGNFQTEAYMRSGNLPARYELSNNGTPTYVPALAHWGTSVIMDGRFDDDKAYVFTANSLTNTFLNQAADSAGDVILDVDGEIIDDDTYWYIAGGNQVRQIGYAITVDNDAKYNSLTAGMAIEGFDADGITPGVDLINGTKLANPVDPDAGAQPYLANIETYRGFNSEQPNYRTRSNRTLLVIDRKPLGEENDKVFKVTVSSGTENDGGTGTSVNVSKEIPIISIRLAPSVDTNTPGLLGEREIINRMQLILNEVDILTTHSLELELRLNTRLNNNNWERVENPSLSELIYHNADDTVSSGTTVFSFNAEGSDATVRTAVLTTKQLGEVATLGNSILGGDNVFPDGPDVLTIVGKLKEDPSTVTDENPLSVQGRISWSESQA